MHQHLTNIVECKVIHKKGKNTYRMLLTNFCPKSVAKWASPQSQIDVQPIIYANIFQLLWYGRCYMSITEMHTPFLPKSIGKNEHKF